MHEVLVGASTTKTKTGRETLAPSAWPCSPASFCTWSTGRPPAHIPAGLPNPRGIPAAFVADLVTTLRGLAPTSPFNPLGIEAQQNREPQPHSGTRTHHQVQLTAHQRPLIDQFVLITACSLAEIIPLRPKLVSMETKLRDRRSGRHRP